MKRITPPPTSIMMSVFLVIFVSLFNILCTQHLDFRPKTVRMDRFDGMCNGKLPVYYKDTKIALVNNRVTTMSTKIIVSKDVPHDFKLKLTLKRCQSRENLDSCEIYQTITVNHVCDLLNPDEKKPWSPFLKTVHPPFVCPLKKGVYVAENGTFDGSAFSAFPISGWYWKVLARTYDEVTNEQLLCVKVEGQIVPI